METIELPVIPARKPDSHKGDYGRVLVIAGSAAMIGAPAMVGLAALRAGAGLCRLAVPKEILGHVLTICPYATGFPWGLRDVRALVDFADEHDAVAVGPGLGDAPAVRRVVVELLERHAGPLVLDADALNALAALQESEWPKRRNWGNVVLTPHMGEFMRLMGPVMKRGSGPRGGDAPPPAPVTSLGGEAAGAADTADEPPSTADGVPLDIEPEEAPAAVAVAEERPPPAAPDRTALAELLSKATGMIVLLKGHRTVVTDGSRFYTNHTGNPAMATAGSGDVLTGTIASLIGQGIKPLGAAALAAHIHGMAGDIAAKEVGPMGLLATDIIHALPRALAAYQAGKKA